jgi:hypothetical protein
MDWPSVIVGFLVLVVIQEFKSWWSSSARHLQQANVGGTNGERAVADEGTQNRDETESKPAIPSASKDTPPLNVPLSDLPADVQDVELGGEATTAVTIRPERNETGSYPHFVWNCEQTDESFAEIYQRTFKVIPQYSPAQRGSSTTPTTSC